MAVLRYDSAAGQDVIASCGAKCHRLQISNQCAQEAPSSQQAPPSFWCIPRLVLGVLGSMLGPTLPC